MNNTERLKRASTMGNHVGDVFPPKSSKSGLIHTHQSCFMDRYVILSSNLFRPIGFGVIKPRNTVEMGFSIVLMLCGATAFSYITATISSLVYDFDEKNAIYRQKMWNLVRFVGNGKISQELANQLMKEMLIIWQNQLVPAKSDTTKLKQDLTPSLLYQVSLEMHSPLIDHVHSFNSVI
eukprot:395556_1